MPPQHPAAPETRYPTGALVPERQRCICGGVCLDHCRACNYSGRDLEEPCIADPDWEPDDDDLARREGLPAAPETETDANGLTDAEREALYAIVRPGHHVDWSEVDPEFADLTTSVERIVAERVRVVEGERDAAHLALGEQADIEREAFGRGVAWAMGDDEEAPVRLLARAESAEAQLRVVEGERDAARGDLVFSRQTTTNVMEALADSGAETLAAIARAESAEQQWIKAQGERDLLAKAMWDVRASFGFDTDGDKKYHSDDYLEVARSFISDMAEALDDLRKEISSADQDGWGRGYDAATARAESAEAAHEAEKAAHERLRAGVKALADEWAEDYPGPNAACNRTPDEWATDLRALLGGGGAR